MIEFWFEFASTYSYLAAMRVENLARQYGCSVSWRPFLLGPIFREHGLTDSPFNLYPVKGRYMWRDLERICAGMELPFRKPSSFPRKGLLAARVACSGADAAWVPEFVRRTYAANFVKDQDIADPAVVQECLDGLVADPKHALALGSGNDAKARLHQNTERALRLGIFGAPSFVVGDELFWGNDRLEAALEWWRSSGKSG